MQRRPPEEVSERIARLQAKWFALSPAERARIEASLATSNAPIVAVEQALKNLLHRLGVSANLNEFEELWLQMWAAARYVRISSEEFWNLTPRQLCAVLEHRATELELLRRTQPAQSSATDPMVVLLERVVAEHDTSLEAWGRDRGIKRTQLMEWKRLRTAGKSLKGAVRTTMDLKIRTAIQTDAKKLGLPLPPS